MEDLQTAKNALSEALGKKWDEYQVLLRRWFRRQISKQQLDNSVRALLKGRVALHTDFILSILYNCQGSGEAALPAPPRAPAGRSSSTGARSRSRSTRTASTSSNSSATTSSTTGSAAQRAAATADPAPGAVTSQVAVQAAASSRKSAKASEQKAKSRYSPYSQPSKAAVKKAEQNRERLAKAEAASWRPSVQPVLPDLASLKARVEAQAYRNNLQSVHDDVARVLLQAVEIHIRKILTASSHQAATTHQLEHNYARLLPHHLAARRFDPLYTVASRHEGHTMLTSTRTDNTVHNGAAQRRYTHQFATGSVSATGRSIGGDGSGKPLAGLPATSGLVTAGARTPTEVTIALPAGAMRLPPGVHDGNQLVQVKLSSGPLPSAVASNDSTGMTAAAGVPGAKREVEFITTVDVLRAAQANHGLLGVHSSSAPLLQRLQTMI